MQQAAKGDSLEELLKLFPQPEIVAQGDVQLSVPVLNLGQIAKILKIVGPIFASANPEVQWQTFLAENAEEIPAILAIALGKSIEYTRAMPADLAANALIALWKVNQDFFRSRIMPLMAGIPSLAEAHSVGRA